MRKAFLVAKREPLHVRTSLLAVMDATKDASILPALRAVNPGTESYLLLNNS